MKITISRNLYSEDIKVTLDIFGHDVDVESVWFDQDERETYIHVGCIEFEGDLKVSSISDKNINTLYQTIKPYLNTLSQ